MSPTAVNNPPPPESKAAKKKRTKSEINTTAADSTNPGTPTTESATNGINRDGAEPAFVKDLHKGLRNATKKLNATSKVDAIVAEHPGKSLDELVAAKIINADQMAQVLKKPGLQASVVQFEEQISQFKLSAEHYEGRLASQKAEFEKAHRDELESLKEKVATQTKESIEKQFKERLLVLSRFLRAAAAMRRDGDETSSDSRAFEGALFQVYGGTEEAVDAMLKLIDGPEEKVPSVDAEPLDVTYARVKQASVDYNPAPEVWDAQPTQSGPAPESLQTTDPTVANAGLTEIQGSNSYTQNAPTNGVPSEEHAPPVQSVVNGGANELAQSNWENQAPSTLSASATADGWVDVQAPAESSGPTVAPQAAPPTYQSWAEDVPSRPKGVSTPTDGFEQVIHHTRQNSGRGRGFRGRGPRGDGFRGRGGGFRGDFRGRGRGRGGEFRGGRGRGGGGYHQAAAPSGDFSGPR